MKRVGFPQLRRSYAMWSSLMATAGSDSFCSLFAGGGQTDSPMNPYVELALWLIGRARHTLPAIGLGLVEKRQNSPETDAQLRGLRDSLREEMEQCLGEDGVFLYPTHPLPAPYHNQPVILVSNFAYTGVFNVLGMPATAVPMGLAGDEGVPVGVQVVAGRYCDRLTLAVALEMEKAFGGWVPPFPVSK